MADELQALRLAEQGIAFVERNPGMLTRLGEFAAATWSRAGRVVGLASKESAVVSEASAVQKAAAAAHAAGKTESLLVQAERAVSSSGTLSLAEKLTPAATSTTKGLLGGGNPFATFGSHAGDFLTPKKLAFGTAGLSLGLAGCDNKKTAKIPDPGDKPAVLPGDDFGPAGTASGATQPSDGKAKVAVGSDGIPVVTRPEGQQPQRGYPGGIGPDVKDVQELINNVPGKEGYLAQQAFSLFLHNYNSRVDENSIPKSLPLVDLPTDKEAKRQFVWGNIDHWKLKYDVDMYVKEPQGPFGTRDLRPKTDIAPGGGKRPPMFFAVGVDKENKPVDILEYINTPTGPKYREQYQFKYDKVDDGRMRVTVFNWMGPGMTNSAGPKEVIGSDPKKVNTLEGVSQYYYDAASGKCTEALYYEGFQFNQPKANWKPTVDMRFGANSVDISSRSPRSGEMLPFTTLQYGTNETERTIRGKAAQLNFFNLLGPQLRDLPNGQ